MAFFIPESPKYLFKKGLTEQCASVLQTMARMNGADTALVSNQAVLDSYKGIDSRNYDSTAFQNIDVITSIQNDERPDTVLGGRLQEIKKPKQK